MEEHRHSDEFFKKLLENYPAFEPAESDIQDMNRRLDEAEHPKSRGSFGMWWIPFFLIPTLLGGLFLFNQNQNLYAEIQHLNTLIKTKEINNNQVNKHTTYIFDTIYRTTYLDREVDTGSKKIRENFINKRSSNVLDYQLDNLRTFANYSPLVFSENKNIPFQYFQEEDGGINSSAFTSLQTYNFVQDKNRNSTAQSNQEGEEYISEISTEVFPIPSLESYLEEKNNKLTELDELELFFELKKRRRSPLYHMTPKGIRIGLMGSPTSTAAFSGVFDRKNIRSIGISTEIEFSDRLRLQVGAQYAGLKFEEKDQTIISQFPSIEPDDPGDVIRELYVELDYLQVPITFKYLLSKPKQWTPFLSVGFAATQSIRQGFSYEFINGNLGEYSRSQKFNNGEFSIENFYGSLGMEYRITNKIFADANIFYLHDLKLNSGEYFLLRNMGLNLGLKYKL